MNINFLAGSLCTKKGVGDNVNATDGDWSNTSADEITCAQKERIVPSQREEIKKQDLPNDDYIDKSWTRIYKVATEKMHMTIAGTTANQLDNTYKVMAGSISNANPVCINRAIIIQIISNTADGITADMMQEGMCSHNYSKYYRA